MTDEVKVPGRKITLSSREYVLAPLKLSQLKDLEDDIARLSPQVANPDLSARAIEPTVPNPDMPKPAEQRRIVARVVMASLSRNYATVYGDRGDAVPLSEDNVLDLLDMGNWIAAFNAALAVSGLEPGEAAAGAGSAFAESTPPSPQRTAGPTETSERIH